MNVEHHTQPHMLERYSFLWSEARLLIAAVALFIGGIPPLLAWNPISSLYNLFSGLLTIAWILSGIASAYLLYRWTHNAHVLFGKKDQKDTVSFFISIVSGLNLGLAGITGNNIGMAIAHSRIIFSLVGLLYVATAVYLYKRWSNFGNKIF